MAFTSSLSYKETLTQEASGSLTLLGSGSTGRTDIFSVAGNNGTLFSVSDDLSNSLFSVNTVAGLPVIEAFADNAVNIGKYGAEAIVVSGSGGDLQLSGSVKLVSLGTAADTNVVVFNSSTKKLAYNTALSLQGAQGAQGTQGVYGTQGAIGTATQGTTGTQGIQGIAGGGGGGTTINPTNNYIPYRSNSTTFQDSFWRINPSNSDIMETTFGVSGPQQGIYLNFDAPSFLLTDELGYAALRWDSFRRLYSNNTYQVALDWQESTYPRIVKTTSEVYQNDFYVSATSQSVILSEAKSNGDLWWSGHTIQGEVGTANIGDVCYLDPTTGLWEQADFNNGRCTNLLGIYVREGAQILLDGHVVGANNRATTDPYVGLQDVTSTNYSQPLYGNVNFNGYMQNGAPVASGDYVRILGHGYKYEGGENLYLVFFRPSNDWVLL
jgi:hypothetical protein